MREPSVAVIIPCWNAERWVWRAIQSVLDQDHPRVEGVVVDDGSTDGSLDVIQSFGDRVRWETGPNKGAPSARNRGMALTESEFILFLDADDYLESDAIGHWIKAAQNVDVVFGQFDFIECGKRQPGNKLRQPATRETVIADWLAGCFVASGAVLWRRSFLQEIGGWNEGLRRNQDGELALRALIDGARFAICDRGRFVYERHDNPNRITQRRGQIVSRQQIDILDGLRDRAEARGLDVGTAFGPAYYQQAVNAFASDLDDLGYEALQKASESGFRGHRGSLAHRVLSGTLGLRNKVRLRSALPF